MDDAGRVEVLDRISGARLGEQGTVDCPIAPDASPCGTVIAVSGSQAVARFAPEAASAADTALTVGSLVGIKAAGPLTIGTLCDISVESSASGQSPGVRARIDLLGEIAATPSGGLRFEPGITAYPKIGGEVVALSGDDLHVIFGLDRPGSIRIGTLQQDASIPAALDVAELVSKHFAIVGSTGSGKSSGLALILRKILDARNDLRVLLIDAHNEYAECFDDRAHVLGPADLKLPFWLLNFDEIVHIVFGARTRAEHEVALLAELIPHAKTEYARAKSALRSSYRPSQSDDGRYTVDTPVPYRFEDLIAAAESRMGKLENGDHAIQYQRLLMRINAARKNPRYGFIFDDGGSAADCMVGILRQVLRLKDEERPMAIVQLAGFPSETTEVIVSALFRVAFEFGVWSDGCSPLLIVCEEAHNYANADRSVGFRTAREGLSRIAKEGRKHGVFLGLVTQRPHQLDGTLISQCSTIVAMRLGHEDDQRIVRAAVSDSASRQLAFLPSLGTREALAIGAGVPTVMRLRFEELAERHLPTSQSAWGGAVASENTVDDEALATIVARWRGAAPAKAAAAPRVADIEQAANGAMNWSAPTYRG